MGGVAQDSQMDWMRGRTDGTDDYIHIEDRLRWLLLFLKRDRIETVGNSSFSKCLEFIIVF